MKSLVIAAAAALTFVSMTETALAEGQIGDMKVGSCEITVPFKLKDSERAILESKGYRFRVKKSHFTRERMNQSVEFYEMKDSKKTPGQLFVKAVIKPFEEERLNYISKREFQLNLATEQYDQAFAVAFSVPPKFSRSIEEGTNANFSSTPNCVE